MVLSKRLLGILLSVAIILLVPFVAMQISPDVNWSGFDFMVAGILLFSTAIIIELIFSKIKSSHKRVLFILLILTALLLIWAELAVGIFGSPLAGS